MLLKPKRNKLRSLKIATAIIGLMIVFFGIYAFFALQRPTFITPLAKNAVFKASNLTSLFNFFHISFVAISQAKDLSFDVELTNGAHVLITPKKDLIFQVSSLQQIIKQLTIEGRELKKIDFRFDKPVIIFK